MNLYTLIMAALIIGSIVYIFYLKKQNSKNDRILDILKEFSDFDKFSSKLNAAFQPENTPAFTAKLQALRIWGGAYHGNDEMFHDGLENIEFMHLIDEKKKKNQIGMNESAFFWVYLFTPNNLYSKGRTDLMDELYAKLDMISEPMKDQMVKQLGDADRMFYQHTGDRGRSFYEKVLDGDYADIQYIKELIGLYKQIITAMLCKLYQESGDQEDFEASLPMLKEFHDTPVGKRWMSEIGLDMPKDDEEEQPESSEEEVENVETAAEIIASPAEDTEKDEPDDPSDQEKKENG